MEDFSVADKRINLLILGILIVLLIAVVFSVVSRVDAQAETNYSFARSPFSCEVIEVKDYPWGPFQQSILATKWQVTYSVTNRDTENSIQWNSDVVMPSETVDFVEVLPQRSSGFYVYFWYGSPEERQNETWFIHLPSDLCD